MNIEILRKQIGALRARALDNRRRAKVLHSQLTEAEMDEILQFADVLDDRANQTEAFWSYNRSV